MSGSLEEYNEIGNTVYALAPKQLKYNPDIKNRSEIAIGNSRSVAKVFLVSFFI